MRKFGEFAAPPIERCARAWRSLGAPLVWPVILALLACCSIGSCRTAHGKAGSTLVQAQVQSCIGRPYGCTFIVLDRQGNRVCTGFTDNLGEIRQSVEDGRVKGEVTLVVFSLGWIRNTWDECQGAGRRLEVPKRSGEGRPSDPERFRYPPALRNYNFSVDRSEDVVARYGANHSVTLYSTDGLRVCDSVAKTIVASEGAVLDFGSMRFPGARAAAEVFVSLESPEGRPSSTPVVLGGFSGDVLALGGNRVYPHMSLSQRGGLVRVLLTRAALRLLLANPRSFLCLNPVGGLEAEGCSTIRVALDDQAAKELRRGRTEVRVRVRHDASSSLNRSAEMRKIVFPQYWDLMEPNFCW